MDWKTIKWEIDLLEKLVAIDSINTGDTRQKYPECAALIQEEAEKLGLGVEIIDGVSAAGDGESRPNVVIDLDKGSDVDIIFVTHYDVVTVDREKWATNPFKLTIKGDKAFGRGAADDKGGIVSVLGAMRQLLKEDTDVNFKLCAACDEESGGAGGIAYLFNQAKIRGKAGVVVDSGPEFVGIGCCGVLWGKVLVKGQGGYSGNPDILDNPIHRASSLIHELQKYHETLKEGVSSRFRGAPNLGKPHLFGRFTISMIKAWLKENVVPNECEFRFDRRLIPEEDPEQAAAEIEAHITNLATQQGTNVEIDYVRKLRGYYMEPEHPWAQLFKRTVETTLNRELFCGASLGFDDGMHLAEVGVPVTSFGTIRLDTCWHSENEFVWLEDIQNTRNILVELGRVPADKFNF